MKMFKKRGKSTAECFDYSGVYEREQTIERLLSRAAAARRGKEEYWRRMNEYYNGRHLITASAERFAADSNLPFIPAQSTDAYLHVETQINPDVPDFEFSPRDKTDYEKAKQREHVVRYICDNNDLQFKNSRNERRLCIEGSAVWKVCWDEKARFCNDEGDVTVLSPKNHEIYPDPDAVDVDSCEYIGYVYRIHRNKAQRLFGTGCLDGAGSYGIYGDDGEENGDTVTVTEWYFRQTCSSSLEIDGESYEWKAGDIALCILVDGREVRYVPKYWKKTGFDCYPFVIYPRIPDENSVFGKSELEAIIPLIDAKDRELAYAQLNAAFSSNDIVIMEENALADEENLDNSPGAVWKLRPGMMGKVARLGNMASAQQSLYAGASYWQSLIESTTGNFEVSQGKEPSNVTTATGIALLNERSQSRKNLKNIDRSAGFRRLFELIDKTSLEHYGDGRIIKLGEGEKQVYSYGGFVKKTREKSYIPAIDVTVHTGSPVLNSKAFTVSALSSLMSMKIDGDNYKLVKAYIEEIGIPQRVEICEYLDRRFEEKDNGETDIEEILKLFENETENGGNSNE